MNIAERRRPQDGRVRLKIGDRTIDFRVSVIPTVKGESVVIRVLEKSAKLQSLESLGFAGRDLSDLIDVLHRNAGIILVTGATGSGKSSTLYAALQKLVERNLHTISIEEPVESEIQGVEQIQVNNAAGYTFALALRNILRHDPDAIMVGEIRDQETAKIALESAMTGHLVLSTLHTNDAPSTIARLLEMGIEPYLLSAALLGIVSQRLVRLNCPHCLQPEVVPPEILERLNVKSDVKFSRSTGCTQCNNTGTGGRTLAYEFLRVTPTMRHMINEERPAAELREQANRDGMIDLGRHAVQMAETGRITLEQAYLVKQG
jgi:type IV pilus assembly protein PilB